jgi:hypothetical protein
VVITTLPSAGTLFLLSFMPMPPMGMQTIKTPLVAGQAIPVSQITGGVFVYEPAANANGANYSSFTFQVRDNGGTANGGQNTDGTPNTITFDVTAVNDAPTITNLGTNNVAWTEGGNPVRLDAGLDAVVGDIDSADFDGGTLSVTYTNGLPEDRYTIDTSGTVSVTVDANGRRAQRYLAAERRGRQRQFRQSHSVREQHRHRQRGERRADRAGQDGLDQRGRSLHLHLGRFRLQRSGRE